MYTNICTCAHICVHMYSTICLSYVFSRIFTVYQQIFTYYVRGFRSLSMDQYMAPYICTSTYIYVYVYIFTYVYRVYTYIILPYISEYLHIMYRNSDQRIFTYYVQEFRSLSMEQYMAIYLCTCTHKSVHTCIYICLPCIYLHIFTIYQRIFTYYVREFRPLSIDCF